MIGSAGPLGLETIRVLRNGRRRYDLASKQRLVEACLQPGVSLASTAMQHGVNANVLRKWVAKRQLQIGDGLSASPEPAGPAFIPVIEGSRAAPAAAGVGAVVTCPAVGSLPARLKVSLPNGVTLTLEGGDAQLVSVMIEALGRCDVPSGG
jgi:transposase